MRNCARNCRRLRVGIGAPITGKLHLRLCPQGWRVNIERVERLYRQEDLMAHKRKRKKVAPGIASPSSEPANRTRTPTWNPSTADSLTNA